MTVGGRRGGGRPGGGRPGGERPGGEQRDRREEPTWQGIHLTRKRAFAILAAAAVAVVVITARLAYVEVFSASGYSRYSRLQDTRTTVLPALRGEILDSSGQPLALSVMRYSVIADPYQITQPATEAAALAPLVGVPAAQLTPELAEHTGYVVLARQLHSATAKKVMALNLAGIVTQSYPQRYYPAGQLALPLIGGINSSGAGASGLEYSFNRLLSGTPGKLIQQVDPQGRAIAGGTVADRPAVLGRDVVLTIDEALQYQTEQALAQAIITSHGHSGVAMVMDTHTGGLLAVADLSMPTSAGATPALPVAIGPQGQILPPGTASTVPQPVESSSAAAFTHVYEPGSLEKLVTVSGALASGAISPTQQFDIPPAYVVDGIPLHDAEHHGDELLSVTGILAQSSNIGAAQIAQREGPSTLYRYLHSYGLGAMTPVNFPGESAGLIPKLSTLSPLSLATMAYGEGMAVTAAQMVTAYNTLANGGVYVAPHLVQSFIGPRGQVTPAHSPAPHRVVPATVAKEMTSMLEQVVAAGTGTAAKVAPYAVAGKTGTAQLVGPHGYVAGRTVSSFAGFAPAQNPAVTVLVTVFNTPDYGAQASAPAFSTIMRDALADLQVPSSGPQPKAEPTALPQPVKSGAA